jgi:hypothetical protein
MKIKDQILMNPPADRSAFLARLSKPEFAQAIFEKSEFRIRCDLHHGVDIEWSSDRGCAGIGHEQPGDTALKASAFWRRPPEREVRGVPDRAMRDGRVLVQRRKLNSTDLPFRIGPDGWKRERLGEMVTQRTSGSAVGTPRAGSPRSTGSVLYSVDQELFQVVAVGLRK